jgi:hypothetical protein
MHRSLRIGLLILWGCLPTLTAHLVLPQPSAAAQGFTQKISATNRLFKSVQTNDLAGVQTAVGEGADVQARDRWGMTPADIAIDRGYYRIAHFLAAARNLQRGQEIASSAPSSQAKDASPAGSVTRQKAPAPDAIHSSLQVDSPSDGDNEDSELPWPAGEPNPFDPAAPAPGSQLRSMHGY